MRNLTPTQTAKPNSHFTAPNPQCPLCPQYPTEPSMSDCLMRQAAPRKRLTFTKAGSRGDQTTPYSPSHIPWLQPHGP